MKRVLVVGGAGFIGSHTCKLLASRGHEPIVLDNLSAGHEQAVRWGPLVRADIRDSASIEKALADSRPDAVIHFAAHAYVGESVTNPAKYYDNNVTGTLVLLEAMRRAGIGRMVFSSSCATYGNPGGDLITEATRLEPINPYGWSKRMVEQVLSDYSAAYDLSFVTLRYFNAAGADPDGELSERHDPETHLIPRTLLAAAGQATHLDIFGDDYPTPDGTCIRDFIHVMDLAEAHVAAIDLLDRSTGAHRLNVGTGVGSSILEIVRHVERVVGRAVPTIVRQRRPGDPPILVADPRQANEILGFRPRYSDIDTIIRTAWPAFAGSAD
ncbi:UDP-glucose 4-epimerase GalE [Bauldia litoralis]|uniref:UDP-glucose 4-epimerase n=1 Tax=Bauldia litoralis TaxID=665467 RepID=A0A1G6E9R7_9HYPH|nr:UDP-glucose 4-epimerase GalE [Bauldia litoralis]SDB54146.1 UDP-L-arabinose 4-epimerase [Bauldia litoralis]